MFINLAHGATWNTCCDARTEEHAFVFCVFNGLLQLPFSLLLAQHGGFESTLCIACGGSCAKGSPWHRRYSKMALSCQHDSKFYLNLVEIFHFENAKPRVVVGLGPNVFLNSYESQEFYRKMSHSPFPILRGPWRRSTTPRHSGQTFVTLGDSVEKSVTFGVALQAKPRKASLMLG